MSGLASFSDFTFGEPLALAALLALPVAALALRYARSARLRVRSMLGGPPGLRGGASEGRRLAVGVLLVGALALAVLAAARPQWGEGDRALEQRGIDLVVALDVSRSMEAPDVSPSRAVAAAAGLEAMLEHLTGNRVGLVVFAGSAFERAPLTVDLPVLSSMVARAQNEAPLVRPGTDLAGAIEASLNVLDVADPARTQAVLLVSDGEDLEAELGAAVALANERGVRVYTVFAATTEPTLLPSLDGGDITTAQPDTLMAIAEGTGGEFREVGQVAGLAVEFRRLQQTQFASDTEPALIDRFPWFVGGALALVGLALLLGEGGRAPRPRLRQGVIGAMLAAALLGGCGTTAWRQVEEGNRAYEEQRYEDALDAYATAEESAPDDPAVDYNIANALHQLRRLEEASASASEALAAALEADDPEVAGLAHFTLGNTSFRREQWEAARDSYMAALRVDPEDREAKANLELVLAILNPADPPPGEEGDSGQGEGGEGEGEQPGEDGEDSQPGDGEQPGEGDGGEGEPGQPGEGEPQPGDGQPSGGETMTLEEARQALAEALGDLGPEVTEAEALRILELARQANELDPLPDNSGGRRTPR